MSQITDPSAAIHPTEQAPRIEPLPTSEMRQAWLDTLSRIPGDGLKGAGFPHNVLGTLMHSPDVFGPFLEYWVSCKSDMSLSVREQELVILRMGALYRSDYVWKHHVPVAIEFGVNDSEIDAIKEGSYRAVFNQQEQALLVLTDEMVNQRTIGRAAWDAHADHLSHQQLVDLVHLISQYVLFALMNNVAQVQVEDAISDVLSLRG